MIRSGGLITSRVERDMAIDHFNPEQQLPQFTRTEEQIPDFRPQMLRMDAEGDGEAMDQVRLVQTGRANFVLEDGKYNQQPPSESYFPGSTEYGLGEAPRGTVVGPTSFFDMESQVASVDL